MRTVDEILRDHDAGITRQGAESQRKEERFPRARHIDTVRSLSTISGWKTTGFLVMHWGIIIASLVAVVTTMHWAVLLVAALLVASRMQALGVMMHDAAHYLLYKNRTVNDVVSELFIAFPLGISTTLYRKTHFRHHRFTNTEEDQDLAAQRAEREWFVWPKSKLECAWVMIRTLFGLNVYRSWVLVKHWAPWMHLRDPFTTDFPLRSRVLYILCTILLYSGFVWGFNVAPWETGAIMVTYTLSGLTILNLINRLRASAEHLGVPCTHELNSTRTVIPSAIERFFIAPYGVNYHLEHHLYPSVPGYNLARLHRSLMKDPEFAERAHITRGYTGFIRELMNGESTEALVKDSQAGETSHSESAVPPVSEMA